MMKVDPASDEMDRLVEMEVGPQEDWVGCHGD